MTPQITWTPQRLLPCALSPAPHEGLLVFCLGLILKGLPDQHQPGQDAVFPSSSIGGRVVKLLIQEPQN